MLISVLSILVMLLGFTLLIFVHELGHFLAAKWAGIRAEAFAVGMGPVVVSFRRGVGVRPGSTDRHLRERFGKSAIEMSDGELAEHGIGETEYSIRALPIGGFVKMLGQDDADPGAVSGDTRSYQRCSVGRRMVVISAGVIMNILLAVLLFVVVFMIGVRLDAPVIGYVEDASPAAIAWPRDAQRLGITEPGLQPGDRVVRVGDREARTFADVQIAAALARPSVPIRYEVERDGVDDRLHFAVEARRDPVTRMMAIGVDAGRSVEVIGGRNAAQVNAVLERTAVGEAGILAGSVILEAGGRSVRVYEEVRRAFAESQGEPVHLKFRDPAGDVRTTTLRGEPQFDVYVQPAFGGGANWDPGLIGLSPILRVGTLTGGPNRRLVRAGDEIIAAGDVAYPRFTQLRDLCMRHAGRSIDVTVRGEDGVTRDVTLRVSRAGLLGIPVERAIDVPMLASPIREASLSRADAARSVPVFDIYETPARDIDIAGGAVMLAVNDRPVTNWTELFLAVRDVAAAAHAAGEFPAPVVLRVGSEDGSGEVTEHALLLDERETQRVLGLGWSVPTGLSSGLFEPQVKVVSAGGNPFRAVLMGLAETHVFVVNTYLTIDRLLRRTVAVDQLRGPIGIIDLGARVLPRGFMYFLLLLAMISVNLAVLNFLPMPIVDGGHFLYLIYEKITGRPPSIAFQNAAMLVGLALIGTLFVVTFYNDIARLVG